MDGRTTTGWPAARPVFSDPTGARWRRVVAVCTVVVLAVVGLLAWSAPAAFAPVWPAGRNTDARFPYAVGHAHDTLPAVGTGIFSRIARVTRTGGVVRLADPFSDALYRRATSDEVDEIGDHSYVRQRFGTLPDRVLALTFDDGPSATDTPELLDVLARNHVPATFFGTGGNVLRNADVFRRLVREGHAAGIHTFQHVDFDEHRSVRNRAELVGTDRVMRSVAGYGTRLFRLPYGDEDANALGITLAQQLGYLHAGYDIDTGDWRFPSGADIPVPRLDGHGHVVLMHDGGGDRASTPELTQRLIDTARAMGYTFTTIAALAPTGYAPVTHLTASRADRTTWLVLWSVLVLPGRVIDWLFWFGVSSLSIVSLWFVVLAVTARRRRRAGGPRGPYAPLVSIVIAAFNEARVIDRTLTGLAAVRYPYLEVVVVDDGSTDDTLQVLCDFCAAWPPVRVVTQPNRGKAAALNHGFVTARGEVVVTLDADTQLDPDTVSTFVRHFADPRVGAVAGHVKVGNRRNLLTAWQSLEYLTGICVSRAAEGRLRAITIAPGACAAWRRDVVLAAGGWPGDTFAEDCDLTLTIHRMGYRVEQDTAAVAWTEVPMSVRALVRQRIRWTYGNLQAYRKHRDMVLRPRYGWLGLFVLPMALTSILVPLVFLPLTYVFAVLSVAGGNWRTIALFTAFVTAVQLVMSAVAVVVARERPAHLLVVPVYRLIWEPLRFCVLYAAVFQAVRGSAAGWYRPRRTGTVRTPGDRPARSGPRRRKSAPGYQRRPVTGGGVYRPVRQRRA